MFFCLFVFLSFFTLACERTVIKMHNIESRCYRTGKYTICRHVHVSFSPEILQAGAMKELKILWSVWEFGGLLKQQNNPECTKIVRVFILSKLNTIQKKRRRKWTSVYYFGCRYKGNNYTTNCHQFFYRVAPLYKLSLGLVQ